ncbi:hypothetical protein Pelo_19339 [Pelomyxa schiedti]|nr:hypothetical protein Pelo_19339 [Pelomyxa schiedti]
MYTSWHHFNDHHLLSHHGDFYINRSLMFPLGTFQRVSCSRTKRSLSEPCIWKRSSSVSSVLDPSFAQQQFLDLIFPLRRLVLAISLDVQPIVNFLVLDSA